MRYSFPNNLSWKQANKGEYAGGMYSSFALNTRENYGKLKPSSRLIVNVDVTTLADLQTPVSFQLYNQLWYAAGGRYVYKNDGTSTGVFAKDASSNAPDFSSNDVSLYQDMVVFNNWLLVSGQLNIKRLIAGTWDAADYWNITLSQANLVSNSPHPMHVARIGSEKLLIGDGANLRIVTTGGSVSTLALGATQRIKWIKSGATRIWIGCMSTSKTASTGRDEGLIYEWDGSTSAPTRSYRTGCLGTYAGLVEDEIPYAVMANGEIDVYSGGEFVPAAVFPNFNSRQYFKGIFDASNPNVINTNFIHPNGFNLIDGVKTLLICSELDDSTFDERIPSGIWQLDENGLHHTKALSLSNSVDYGVFALKSGTGSTTPAVGGIAETQQTGSSMFAGAAYDNIALATKTAIFHESTSADKRAILSVPFVKSPDITSNWQKFILKHKKDQSATFVAKFRAMIDPSVTATATWASTTSFTTTTDISSVSVGDEILIMSGAGAGMTVHITAITNNAGTYTVTVDEAALVTATNQSRILITNWTKLGSKTDTAFISEFQLMKASATPNIQGRVEIRGSTELEEFITDFTRQE